MTLMIVYIMLFAPGILIGLLVGAWALIVLTGPDARAAFATSDSRDTSTVPSSAGPSNGGWEGWWQRRHPWLQKSVNSVLLCVYLGGLLMFVSFHGSGNREAFDHAIGYPNPWYTVHKDAAGFESSIHLLSNAWFMLAVGLLAFYLHWRLAQATTETHHRFAFPKVHAILWSAVIAMGFTFCWLPFFLGAIDVPSGTPVESNSEVSSSETQPAVVESSWVDLLAEVNLTQHEVGFRGPATTNHWTRDESGSFVLTDKTLTDGLYVAGILVPPFKVSGEYQLEATFVLNDGDEDHLAWPVITFPVRDRALELYINHQSGPSVVVASDRSRAPDEPLSPHVIAAGLVPVTSFDQHTLRLSVQYGEGSEVIVNSTIDAQPLVFWKGNVADLPDKRSRLPQPGLIGLGAVCKLLSSFVHKVTYVSARIAPIASSNEHDGLIEGIDLQLPRIEPSDQERDD